MSIDHFWGMKMSTNGFYESWYIGGGKACLYTEDRRIMMIVKSSTNVMPATYSGPKGVYAWQFVLKSALIPLLDRKFAQNSPLISKELRVQEIADSGSDAPVKPPSWSALG